MRWLGNLAFAAVLGMGMACSLILDFGLEVECWCGEQWTAQISGAHAARLTGGPLPIPASDTTYVACVSQLEHLALDAADPQDPLYIALRANLESGAIAQCEKAGALLVGVYFTGTDCATTGMDPVSSNVVHTGACSQSETYDVDAELCPIEAVCGDFYDCSNEPIVGISGAGDDEAGDDLAWECDEPAI